MENMQLCRACLFPTQARCARCQTPFCEEDVATHEAFCGACETCSTRTDSIVNNSHMIAGTERACRPDLQAIPSLLRHNIVRAFAVFMPHGNPTAKSYWPRSFRDFVKHLAKRVQGEDLSALVHEMQQPTSHFIPVRFKRQTKELLEKILKHSVKLEHAKIDSVAASVWPQDIFATNDLSGDMAGWELRADVNQYLLSVIKSKVPDANVCIDFDKDASPPISIRLEKDADVQVVCDELQQLSLAMESGNSNCLPHDLVKVVKSASSLQVCEDGFHTFGSPLRKGQ